MPFPWTCRLLRSAALYRIQLVTCFFVPMPYLYSETNYWSNDWAIERSDVLCFGQYQLLAKSIKIFISRELKRCLEWPEIYKALKTCCLLNWVSIARVVACCPQASRLLPTATAADSETPSVFLLARPTHPSLSSARELPKEPGGWFCPQNLRLPSGTPFGEIARRPAGAQTWIQTWALPPD